jgi:hypothetical protein
VGMALFRQFRPPVRHKTRRAHHPLAYTTTGGTQTSAGRAPACCSRARHITSTDVDQALQMIRHASPWSELIIGRLLPTIEVISQGGDELIEQLRR